jgi:hypothetical protein
MFVNEKSREYQFYNLTIMVTTSPIVDTLTFVSRARESVQKEFVVTNPLAEEADFNIRCDKLLCPDVLRVNRNSEVIFNATDEPTYLISIRSNFGKYLKETSLT